MHNLYTILAKTLEINKRFSNNLADKRGNIPRRDVVPKNSDLEVISLSMAAGYIGIEQS